MDIIPRIPPVIQSGVVLVSQPGEHNHYLYQQTVQHTFYKHPDNGYLHIQKYPVNG